MRRGSRSTSAISALALALLSSAGAAQAQSVPCLKATRGSASTAPSFASYWPLSLGYSWKYTDSTAPSNFFHESVNVSLPFGGNANAVEMGPDAGNGFILANDGTTFTLLGTVDTGMAAPVTPQVVLDPSNFVDGHTFSFSPIDEVLIRDWSVVGPLATNNFGIDPNLPGVIVWVWYDTQITNPPPHNANLEAGFSGTPPPGGVTEVWFFLDGVGPLARVDVDASSGNTGPRFDVFATFDCNGNQVPDYQDADCNGNGLPDDCEPSSEVVRLGTPSNPDALKPGVTSGPVVGQTWDPVVDHTTFMPAASFDFLFVSDFAISIPTASGTLLCNLPPPSQIFLTAPSAPFSVNVPANCTFVGLSLCAQGGSFLAGAFALTNALDIVLGGV